MLLTAAEQLGAAGRVCEPAVQHARTREQFGRPIGAFQAVQHLCADLLVRAETARAAVCAAAVTADPADIAAARLLADEAAVRGARDCLQVHGGMGFTWEADVHLHLKRASVRARRAGGGAESEELLAAALAGCAAGGVPIRRDREAMAHAVADRGLSASRSVDTGLCPSGDSSRPGVGCPLGYLV